MPPGAKPSSNMNSTGAESEITSDWEEAVSSPVVSSSGAVSVCVIGAGVAGLGAAWHLCSSADVTVTVLEASDEAGGHANTIDVLVDGGTKVAVDTGFMVFNHPNYPNLVGLFKELGVRGTTYMHTSSALMYCRIL
jgi:predicted NAD/FAD-binding protein